MAVAALIISILALLVAIGSFWATRVQAKATKDLAHIEQARRLDEKAAAERDRVVWELRENPRGLFRLNNVGTSDAYGVVITARGRTKEVPEIASRGSFDIAWPRLRQVEVAWHYAADMSDARTMKIVPLS